MSHDQRPVSNHEASGGARAAEPMPMPLPPPLRWAVWPWHRCRAVRERRLGHHYGRCELRAPHPGVDHALERGFDTPRWSTDWRAL